ncbi:MAG: tetratricopeptide repeat protein [Oceanidesulfovibrio sp.]
MTESDHNNAPQDQQFALHQNGQSKSPQQRDKIYGIFSSQSVQKVGTGTSVRKTIQKTFWMAKEIDDGVVEIQPINMNCVPSGPKRKIAKEDLIQKFSPEPEYYVQTVYPAMRNLDQKIEDGERHREKGEHFSAENKFRKALEVDVENVRANFGLGLTYLERGESEKADNIFERLVKLDAAFEPEHKHLFNDFGINLRKSKMYDQALEYYGRAETLATADENLYYNMARAYFEKRQIDQAVEYLNKALELDPEHEAASQFLEWIKERNFQDNGQLPPSAYDMDANNQATDSDGSNGGHGDIYDVDNGGSA